MNLDALSLADRPLDTLVDVWGVSVEVLRQWAGKGWIPSAYKHPSGRWFFSPAALISVTPGDVESFRAQTERIRDSRQEGGEVLREDSAKREGNVWDGQDDLRTRRVGPANTAKRGKKARKQNRNADI